MKIREFTMDDYDRVIQLWQSRGIEPGLCDTRDAIAKSLERNPDLFLVAGQDSVLVGVVLGTWDGRRGWIYNQAVDPRFSRMGVGRQLLEEVIRRLATKGAKEIALAVGKDNVSAQDFFERAGFVTDQQQLLMIKNLG